MSLVVASQTRICWNSSEQSVVARGNFIFRYFIVNVSSSRTDSESFDISPSTGLLTTRLEFDREVKDAFSFEVIATDEADGLVASSS